MRVRTRALRAAALGVLAACEPAGLPAPPAFATSLPGHTVVVAWADAPMAPIPALPAIEDWCGLTRVPPAARVAAWTGDAAAVAWGSLADNALFVRAHAACPPGERQWFVDLQQVVDLATRAARSADRGAGASSAPDIGATLRDMIVQRLIDVLHLRGLQWLVAGEQVQGERTHVRALLASADVGSGLLGLLGSAAPQRLPAGWPRPGAQVACMARFVPGAAARIARALTSGDAEGPLQMAREMLRGPRLAAGLSALAALAGDVVACGSAEYQWLWLGVADAAALGDALDVLAQPASDGWLLGRVRLELVDGALMATAGRLPESVPLPAARPGLWIEVPALAAQAWIARDTVAGRLRAEAEFRSPPR